MTARRPEQRQHGYDVANAIEANPDHFSMSEVFSSARCGTAACIAGWSDALTCKLDLSKPRGVVVQARNRALVWFDESYIGLIAERFGLSIGEVDSLCFGSGIDIAKGMPSHLRAKGMADAVRQIANGAAVDDALEDVAERYA